MKKKLLTIITCLCMLVSLLPAVVLAAGTNPFTDVKDSDWYYNNVLYVYEHELMKGISGSQFDPNGATTRGQIVAILYRLEESPEVTTANPFKDVGKGFYYEDAITWAAGHGIVSGYSAEKYGPDDSITREQMASILYRYANHKGYNVEKQADLTVFEDLNKLSGYAKNAMAWANGEGLISGFTATRLEPQGNAVRAQAAAILHRFCVNIVPEEVEEEHIHIWDEGTVVKEATQAEAGEYTYGCIGCDEEVTAVWVKTDEQLMSAMEAKEENIAIIDGTLRAGEIMHLSVDEGIQVRMAGTTTVESGAGIIIEDGNVYIDELILKVEEGADGEKAAGSHFGNMGNTIIKNAQLQDGFYYGINMDEYGTVYAETRGTGFENLGNLTIVGDVSFGNINWMYNEGRVLISKSGRLEFPKGERLEYGYYFVNDQGEVILEEEEWNDERGGENWYDAGTEAGFDNFGIFDVNGELEIGERSYLNNGDWGGANEGVVTNINGTATVYGNLNNILDGAILNVAHKLEVKENGYLGNDGIIHVGKNGKLLLEGSVSFDNSSIGEVIVDGTIELAEAEYIGITEYADEWGNVWGEYKNVSHLNNDGKFTVNGKIIAGAGSNVNNRQAADFIINGNVELKLGAHQEAGYFHVEEDGKVQFTPGEMIDDWGGEHYEEETDRMYFYYDEWCTASYNNEGNLEVNGTFTTAGLNNNAFSYEDENGLCVVEGSIVVAKGGNLTAVGWMNNNSDWYEEDGEIKWANASILIENDAAFALKTLPDADGSYEEYMGAYFGNTGTVVVDGNMSVGRLSNLHNYCNEYWDEDEFVSSSAGECIVNGTLDITDTEVIYETYYEPDFEMDIDFPVDMRTPMFSNDGYLEVNGLLVEKASRFYSGGIIVVGEDGILEFDSIWCDFNKDGIDDTFVGEDVEISGETIVYGEMLNHRRVVCNWGEGTTQIIGKLTMDGTGDLYIGERAGFAIEEGAQVNVAGGRILINDREDARYDEDGNVVEWYGTISKHIEDDFAGIEGVERTASVGSYEGFMAAIEEEAGFDNCDLIEGEYVISENLFIRTELNIFDSARLVVEDGVKVIINNVLYNYMGDCLELQGDACIELVGNTTGDFADHYYYGNEEGFDISEDVKQPIGSDFAYKTTIRNAE